MIWQVVDGKPEPVSPAQIVPSKVGAISIFRFGANIYLQTDDLIGTPYFRAKFEAEEMPKVRKALEIETDKDKLSGVHINLAKLRKLIDTEKA